MSIMGDRTFSLACMIHGREAVKKLIPIVAGMDYFVDMPQEKSWDAVTGAIFNYLDGKPDTPLWMWK